MQLLLLICTCLVRSSSAVGLFAPLSAEFALRRNQLNNVDLNVDFNAKPAHNHSDAATGSKVNGNVAPRAGQHKTSTVWIPSWPRSGSTTIFHMVLAAASEADMLPDVAKALEDRGRGYNLHVPEQPPSEPGCWVLTPTGCHRRQFNAKHWTRDTFAAPHLSRTACEARRSDYNRWCNVTDSTVLFVPAPDYKASPFRRHFGLFEPCHKRWGNKTKADILSPELDGNCKLTMDKLFNCNFTGVEYLWGWNRPHSDITGVTSFGSMPPTFNSTLAHKTCARSDLIVYKTVDEFGRNASDVVDMLENHPHVKAVIPLRDPRAIYASWKQLPWEFPGVSLLKQICDSMAKNIGITHKRLRRISLERLVERPERVMHHVYGFLGLEFGVAQKRWIQNTFNATCSDTAKDSKFYTCHEDSKEPMLRWKNVLTDEEKSVFTRHPSCARVSEQYGLELDKESWWRRLGDWFDHIFT